MPKLLALIAIATIVAPVSADVLVLQDGRTFNGTVTVKGNSVSIEMTYGTVSFPRQEVARIDLKESPETEFKKRLEPLSADDVDGLFRLAQWAQENKLDKQAKELYARVLQLRPDHASARKASGFVKLEGKWMTLDTAIELAQSKFAADRNDILLNNILPTILEAAPPDKLAFLHEMKGMAQLRSKKFVAAAKTFADLSKIVAAPASFRYATLAELLDENPDGMYLLSEPYPPQATLWGSGKKVIPAGPASLARPLVLEAALRDRAKVEIRTGRNLMDEGVGLESTNPADARAKYEEAEKRFDRADALTEGIARSYRIEIARRKIDNMRKNADADARQFDEGLAALGKKNLSPQTYQSTVLRLRHSLDSVQTNLKSALNVAKQYPRELVLEIEWAQQDLRKVESLRNVLTAELDEKP